MCRERGAGRGEGKREREREGERERGRARERREERGGTRDDGPSRNPRLTQPSPYVSNATRWIAEISTFAPPDEEEPGDGEDGTSTQAAAPSPKSGAVCMSLALMQFVLAATEEEMTTHFALPASILDAATSSATTKERHVACTVNAGTPELPSPSARWSRDASSGTACLGTPLALMMRSTSESERPAAASALRTARAAFSTWSCRLGGRGHGW